MPPDNRRRTVMRRAFTTIGVLATLGLGSVGGAMAEEYRGTWQQQMACTPDVFRLCGSEIPDVDRIVTCLRQNTPQLSHNCRAVFEANASVPQPAQRAVPQVQRASPPTPAPPPTSGTSGQGGTAPSH
jgi:hypothetical protein